MSTFLLRYSGQPCYIRGMAYQQYTPTDYDGGLSALRKMGLTRDMVNLCDIEKGRHGDLVFYLICELAGKEVLKAYPIGIARDAETTFIGYMYQDGHIEPEADVIYDATRPEKLDFPAFCVFYKKSVPLSMRRHLAIHYRPKPRSGDPSTSTPLSEKATTSSDKK